MLWPIKNNAELYYCLLLCIYLVHIVWATAGNNGAVLATIVADVQAQFQYYIEVATNEQITRLFYNILLNPSMAASANTSDGLPLR